LLLLLLLQVTAVLSESYSSGFNPHLGLKCGTAADGRLRLQEVRICLTKDLSATYNCRWASVLCVHAFDSLSCVIGTVQWCMGQGKPGYPCSSQRAPKSRIVTVWLLLSPVFACPAACSGYASWVKPGIHLDTCGADPSAALWLPEFNDKGAGG